MANLKREFTKVCLKKFLAHPKCLIAISFDANAKKKKKGKRKQNLKQQQQQQQKNTFNFSESAPLIRNTLDVSRQGAALEPIPHGAT